MTLTAVGCADPATTSTTAPSSSPAPVDEPGYRLQCYAADGRLVGDFTRLEESWASPNYLRTEFCTATFTGATPVALAGQAERTARIAAEGTEGALPDLYLAVIEACTRLGADEGPHSIAGTPESVLRAVLSECPESPQAGLVASALGGSAQSQTGGES